MSKPKPSRPSAAVRLAAAGKVQLGAFFVADDAARIREAAAAGGIPVTEFLRLHATRAAEKILAKSAKRP